MAPRPRARGPLRLALSGDRLTAALGEGEDLRVLHAPCPLPPGGADPADALEEALSGLAARLPDDLPDDLRVEVALLPPLCDARIIELPPLRPGEAESVLARRAARHFVLGRGERVVAAVLAGRAGRGEEGPAPLAVAAAPARLVEALPAAVGARGWTLERIVPAQGAWLAALRRARPEKALPAAEPGPSAPPEGRGPRRARLLAVLLGPALHLVREEEGRVTRVRRRPWPAATAPAEAGGELAEAAGAPRGGAALALAESEEACTALHAALSSAGWAPLQAAEGGEARPEVVAALYAARSEAELVPDALARVRRDGARRLAVRLGALAALVLALTAGLYLWGTARAIDAVQAERAELRAVVQPALAARDTLDRMLERLEELGDLEQAGGWTYPLVELSMLLPSETHLISLRAAGDTVVMEAAGGRAGEALASLRRAPSLRDVRLEGPIQRDLEAGATSRERFTLSALLDRESALPATRGNGAGGAPELERP